MLLVLRTRLSRTAKSFMTYLQIVSLFHLLAFPKQQKFVEVTECIGDKHMQSSLIVSDGEVSIAPHAKGRSEGSIEYTPLPPPSFTE